MPSEGSSILTCFSSCLIFAPLWSSSLGFGLTIGLFFDARVPLHTFTCFWSLSLLKVLSQPGQLLLTIGSSSLLNCAGTVWVPFFADLGTKSGDSLRSSKMAGLTSCLSPPVGGLVRPKLNRLAPTLWPFCDRASGYWISASSTFSTSFIECICVLLVWLTLKRDLKLGYACGAT